MQFERFSRIFGILMILVIITPLPLTHFLRYVGVVIWIVLMAITMCFAIQLEISSEKVVAVFLWCVASMLFKYLYKMIV